MFKIYGDHKDSFVLKRLRHDKSPVVGYCFTRWKVGHSPFLYGNLDGQLFIGSVCERRSQQELELFVGPVADPDRQNRVRITGIAMSSGLA